MLSILCNDWDFYGGPFRAMLVPAHSVGWLGPLLAQVGPKSISRTAPFSYKLPRIVQGASRQHF